jgi:hypothetical protein
MRLSGFGHGAYPESYVKHHSKKKPLTTYKPIIGHKKVYDSPIEISIYCSP